MPEYEIAFKGRFTFNSDRPEAALEALLGQFPQQVKLAARALTAGPGETQGVWNFKMHEATGAGSFIPNTTWMDDDEPLGP